MVSLTIHISRVCNGASKQIPPAAVEELPHPEEEDLHHPPGDRPAHFFWFDLGSDSVESHRRTGS